MTAMTSAAGASTMIDWVDWSAMGSRLAVPAVQRAADPALCYSRVGIAARFDRTSLAGAVGDGAPGRRGGEDQACASSAFLRPPRSAPTRRCPTCSPRTSPSVGDQIGFRVQRDGQWQDVTWKEFGDQVAGVAKGLIASGVAAGDRVALQAKTRYEWTVIDFAIWTAGAVVVPIYETSSADQVAWILVRLRRHRRSSSRRTSTPRPSSPCATRRRTCGRSTSSTTAPSTS